jgi:arylsulfatase A-like enzyme
VIREHDTAEPLFLYMALNAPHSPVVPSVEWRGRSKIDEHADYRMEVDFSVGRIFQALEEKGILENTLLIFTADNGSASFAVKDMLKDGQHDSSDGRRGWKATWFEGGHRVPFIVHWPNGLKGAGRKDADMITLEDFFATVADILKQPLPVEAGDSVSFLPQLQGQPQDQSQREIIMSSLSNKLVLRYKDWKLICVSEAEAASRQSHEKRAGRVTTDPKAPWNEKVVLYNLTKDVAETTNVASKHPAIVAKMAQLAIASIKSGRTNRGVDRPNSCFEIQLDLLKQLSELSTQSQTEETQKTVR